MNVEKDKFYYIPGHRIGKTETIQQFVRTSTHTVFESLTEYHKRQAMPMSACTQCGTFTNEGQICVECTSNSNTLQSSNS